MAELGRAIRELHDAEVDLADAFRAAGERHAADHDVYHLSHTLAKQSEEHAAKLRPLAARYGEDLDEPGEAGVVDSVLETVRRKGSELAGRNPKAGLLLLADLRRLYLLAEECLIDATMVKQGAMARQDKELLETVSSSLAETEVQVKWLKTRIKTAAPQILAVG